MINEYIQQQKNFNDFEEDNIYSPKNQNCNSGFVELNL